MKSAAHDTRYGKNPFACKRLHGFSANGAAPRGGSVGLGGSRNARLGWLAWPGGWAAQGTLQVRPCKLVGAIHGACAPAQPTRPASDTFRRFPRHGKKKEEQGQEQKQHSGEPPGWTSPLPHFDLTDLIHAWRGSTVSTKVDTYQEPPVPTAAGKCRGGAVWVGRTVGAMDGAIEPPWTGLRRVLPTHTAPPNPQKPRAASALALALALALASAGAGRSPAEHPPAAARRYP